MKAAALILAIAIFLPSSLYARTPDTTYNVPGTDGLVIRIVSYNGSTNGSMTVDVINTGKTDGTFSASGLFFIPDMDPESAPQRLGAAGPFTVGSGDNAITSIKLKPTGSQRINLEVFCIDSHRASPNSDTPFRLANELLPKELTKEISKSNEDIYQKYKSRGGSKAARQEIQSNMWKKRDKKWIKIEGERKNEKAR